MIHLLAHIALCFILLYLLFACRTFIIIRALIVLKADPLMIQFLTFLTFLKVIPEGLFTDCTYFIYVFIALDMIELVTMLIISPKTLNLPNQASTTLTPVRIALGTEPGLPGLPNQTPTMIILPTALLKLTDLTPQGLPTLSTALLRPANHLRHHTQEKSKEYSCVEKGEQEGQVGQGIVSGREGQGVLGADHILFLHHQDY
jgi:hypothetical protein